MRLKAFNYQSQSPQRPKIKIAELLVFGVPVLSASFRVLLPKHLSATFVSADAYISELLTIDLRTHECDSVST